MECGPGKWLAGSNNFLRAQPDQSGNAAEAVGPDGLVQVAITYAGTHVTLCRDGQAYADYGVAEPQTFGEGSVALIGLRHLDRRGGQNAYFAGVVRLQVDRGQRVVSTGPYAAMRHPGYAGALLAYVGTPLLLDSRWAFVAVAGIAVALKRDGDRIAGLKLAITGTNSAPLLVPTEAFVGAEWNAATAQAVVQTVRKTSNVLLTTVAGVKYRRRVLLAMTRKVVDELWSDS